MAYTFGWKLKNEGWTETTTKTEEQMKKHNYVSSKLSPAIAGTREWDTCEYKIMKRATGEVREYAVLSCNGGGSRWINVTGNSLGAILTSVSENLY